MKNAYTITIWLDTDADDTSVQDALDTSDLWDIGQLSYRIDKE